MCNLFRAGAVAEFEQALPLGLDGGLLLPELGFVPTDAPLRALLRQAGVTVLSARPTGLLDGFPLVLTHSAGRLACEVVVLAHPVGLDPVESWFEERITPQREQAVRLERPQTGPAITTQQGYIRWRDDGEGGTLLTGCRWATPTMALGERDLSVLEPRIHAKLDAFARDHLGTTATTDRWAWLGGRPCDGLPFVGPLPGTPRRVACVGFHDNPWGLGPAAGVAVARALLTGTSDLPADFAPSRMV